MNTNKIVNSHSDKTEDEPQAKDPSVDTPEDHWERFKVATRKMFTTPKPTLDKKP